MPGLFVTGTDTGVGKTLIVTTLLASLRGLGIPALGMKPVAAGCEYIDQTWVNEDVSLIQSASAIEAPDEMVNPYRFRDAIAPHIAADRKGVKIEIPRVVEAYKSLAKLADIVLVEGAGGFRTPIDARRDMADLAVALGLPVILVVGMRLGCLSHALLTHEAIERRGLRLAGWVSNRLDPAMMAYEENVATLRQRLGVPLLAEIPYMSGPDPLLAMGYVSNPRFTVLLKDL